MLVEIKTNEFINTQHILLIKIIRLNDGKSFLLIEFINGVVMKYRETRLNSLEEFLTLIRNEEYI